MKKKLVLLLLFALLLSSCEKKHLGISDYGADFQKINEVLYMNEECDHFLIYTEVNDSVNGIDKNIYHSVYCKWSTCNEDLHYEPHILRIGNIGSTRAQYKENGYMYHTVSFTCAACDAIVTIHLLCKYQELSCMNATQCHEEFRWEEILCDMPYEISYD